MAKKNERRTAKDVWRAIAQRLRGGKASELTAVFKQIDVDGDGMIDREELEFFLAKIVGITVRDEDLTLLFNEGG